MVDIVNSRIRNLLDQQDFLTQERIKLAAKLKSQEETIKNFNAILHPTLLMAQSLILDWMDLGDKLESGISTSLDTKLKEYFAHPLQIFLNYIGILKLKMDILKSPDQSKQREQIAQFEEKMIHLKEECQQLKKMVGEEYYFQYDLAIDAVFEPHQKRFQEFVKVIDAFHLKLTSIHSLVPSELQFMWGESSEKIQRIEEEIEVIRKKLHNSGEQLIYRLMDGFIRILSQILTKTEEKTVVSLNLEEYTQAQYKDLQYIRDQFLYDIDNEVISSLYDLLRALNIETTAFLNYFQGIFDKFHEITPAIDSELQRDLQYIDQRILEITIKVQELQKKL